MTDSAGRPPDIQEMGASFPSTARASSTAAPTLISGFVSPSERLDTHAVLRTIAVSNDAVEPLLRAEPRAGSNAASWLPPPAEGKLQHGQHAAGTAAGRAPIERVQSSLPDVQERVPAPDAASDSDMGAATGAASRSQLAHSASEVSIELYGSAPSALENGSSHDWGGRAAGCGGSFSAASPRRAAALAAAISAAVGDEREEFSGDAALVPHPSPDVEPRAAGGGPFDDSLAWEHDLCDGRVPDGETVAAQAGTLSAQHFSHAEPAAQQSWPTWADSNATSPSAGHTRQTLEGHSPVVSLWLPSPVFPETAGESATQEPPAAAAPAQVFLPDMFVSCHDRISIAV